MSFGLVGRVWTVEEFASYVRTLDLSWSRGVTMHHAAAPSLAQRPNGLEPQHLRNMRDHYRGLGWSRGPHLFVDDDQVWGMSPLEERGIHAVSFNRTHLGIEVLGNYDTEDPSTGRGLACWKTAARVAAAILAHTGWPVETAINAHRDDPQTSKSCPGSRVVMEDFRGTVSALLEGAPTHDDRSPDPVILSSIKSIEWQLQKLKRHLL